MSFLLLQFINDININLNNFSDAFTPPLNYYRNIEFGTVLNEGEDIEKITVPTLIIWGLDDLALDQAIPVA